MFLLHTGKEYLNNSVQDYLKSENILHFIAYNQYHANYAERVIRTLKGRIYKYMRENLTMTYIDVLQDIVHSYNMTIHSFLHTPPALVTKQNEQQLYEKYYLPIELEREKTPVVFEFQVGDKVRLSKTRHPFGKGYREQWTEEIFIVTHTIPSHPPRYQVKDMMDEPVKSSFYSQELKHVSVTEDTLYRVEKIIRYRTKNNQRQALIKWFGYPDKFTSWTPVSDIQHNK